MQGKVAKVALYRGLEHVCTTRISTYKKGVTQLLRMCAITEHRPPHAAFSKYFRLSTAYSIDCCRRRGELATERFFQPGRQMSQLVRTARNQSSRQGSRRRAEHASARGVLPTSSALLPQNRICTTSLEESQPVCMNSTSTP
jgi:hypothetical protein